MKFSKYFMLAGAAALLAACSSEEPLAPNENAMTAEIANADTYALISVSMPTQEGTRGEVSMVNTDIPSEYQVINGTFLLWETTGKTSEDEAVYVKSVPFSAFWVNDDRPNISRTSTYQLGFEKGTFVKDHTYAGCVLLNTPDTYVMPSAGTTFGAWRKDGISTTMKIEQDGKTYLTMSSAPMVKAVSGETTTYSIKTLVDIPFSKVKDKKTDLKDTDIIGGFYVQRNSSKITLTKPATETLNNGDKIEVKGWAANKFANTSYPIQNVSDAGFSIDFGTSHMSFLNYSETMKYSPSRINWAKGTSYTGEDLSGISSITTVDDDIPTVVYVKENTMAHDLQSRDRTTSVVVKAVYTLKNGTATDLIKAPSSNIYTTANLIADIKAKPVFDGKTNVTISITPTVAGQYTFDQLFTITYGADNSGKLSTTEKASLLSALGLKDTDKLSLYIDGVCYYNIPIKHFGDADTPLEENQKITKPGDYKATQLGRFGIVRNNWYHIEIQSISNIGEPTIPDPDDKDPDDHPQTEMQAIAFTINMLNWAKRTQTENF